MPIASVLLVLDEIAYDLALDRFHQELAGHHDADWAPVDLVATALVQMEQICGQEVAW